MQTWETKLKKPSDFEGYAGRIDNCGRSGKYTVCRDCGAEFSGRIFCYNKICTCNLCLLKRERRSVVRLRDVIKKPSHSHLLRLLTLTLPPSDDLTKSRMKLRSKFKALRRSLGARGIEIGWYIGVDELVYKGKGIFYSHAHIILDSKYIPQKLLSDLWSKLTAGSKIVDIRAISVNSAVRYLSKYMGKGAKMESKDFFPMLHYSFAAFRRKRFYFTSLELKGITRTQLRAKCPVCGSTNLSDLTFVYAQLCQHHIEEPIKIPLNTLSSLSSYG